jgi:RNA polymerase sigma-70 factor (ECF subfamily)
MDHARLSAKTMPRPQSSGARTLEAELALIERVRTGERQVFYELISPYQRAVYIATFSLLQNEADAEDTAQEAFLKAFAHLSSFRAEARFSTWLIQIAVNEARARRRKDRKSPYESTDEREDQEEDDYCPKDFADWRDTPAETLQRVELRRALHNAMASLDPVHRAVFVMRDIEKLSISETAQVLGISQALVKTRLLRARLKMRDALAPGIDGAWNVWDGSWKKMRPW